MAINVMGVKLPPCSKEFAESLVERFRPIDIVSGTDRDDIMISVGEQRVIKFILANVGMPEQVTPEVKQVSSKKSVFDIFTTRKATGNAD